MEEYLTAIAQPLLTEPEAMKITKTTDEMGVLLTLEVSSVDMGFIIGKQGQNIDKIRKVIALYGSKHEAKISVKVGDPSPRKYSYGG